MADRDRSFAACKIAGFVHAADAVGMCFFVDSYGNAVNNTPIGKPGEDIVPRCQLLFDNIRTVFIIAV